MKMRTGFLTGAGAGLMVGAAAGAMLSVRNYSMKTQVGKSLHKLGVAIDRAVDNVVSDLR